ncbi:hypothetical protein [Desulforamulus aeronauticus]|uniref:Uncharacterized protein n=1 Tax=Desulforamulus aeronauticus DSM 10349 TaxID=1121421 RepID=A0A1M6XF22_9FIRM|nr:hypothetical protein [Desulforamulus aeronauticus]SHL04449.1 hypothetical protein SAMN02745123_04009 [Desulforamulus aeronauticus DSM 10349]
MNNHSKRLIDQVLHALGRYEDGKVEEDELLLDIEGISSAIEEEGVHNLVSNLALRIDESRHLYDVEEGKVFLSSEIGEFKKAIQKVDS